MMLSALCAGLAVWLWLGGADRRRYLSPATTPSPYLGRGRVVVTVIVAGAALSLLGLRWAALAGGAMVLAGTMLWLWRRGRSRANAQRTAESVAAACDLIAAQLRVGRLPAQALTVAAVECPSLSSATAAHSLGGAVDAELRRASAAPGAQGLDALAAAWSLSARTGAPLAQTVARVAEELRQADQLRQDVGTELAAARATGKLLALLPVIGVAMAASAGAEPVDFLTGTTLGRSALGLAALLTAAGLVWTEHLAARAGGGGR